MVYATRNKKKLTTRVHRLKGQVEAIERAVEADRPSTELLHQLASVRGAVAGLTAEVMAGQVRDHILQVKATRVDFEVADHLIRAIKTYLK